MGWKRRTIELAHRLGMFGAVAGAYGRRRLTVLAYHRIADPGAPEFGGFIGNVSATPAEFADQMRWVADRFSVVTMSDVAAAAHGGSLPRRPLLITFDDGYRDNLTTAAPILDALGLPASGFLATDLVGGSVGPWWDVVAECFRASQVGEADLPVVGPSTWSDGHRQAFAWIVAAKRLSHDQLVRAVESLPSTLEVSLDAVSPAGLMLGWQEVATMAANGWEFGAHTCSHPILTRLSLADAVREIEGSRSRVADAIGEVPIGFAYPNGQRGDFDGAVRGAVSDAGFRVAFTLVPGPARSKEVLADPLTIRRVYVHHGDGVPRLSAKTCGLPRFAGALR